MKLPLLMNRDLSVKKSNRSRVFMAMVREILFNRIGLIAAQNHSKGPVNKLFR